MEIEKKGKNFSFGFGTVDTVGTGNLSDMKKCEYDSYESKILKSFGKRKTLTKSVRLIAKYVKFKNK